jgi:hypothetical protein
LRGRSLVAVALAFLTFSGGVAVAAPPSDRVLPAGQHTTEKSRRLASTYVRQLQDLNAGIYHCWPWVEVQRASIGFYRPRNVRARTDDDRYLSIRIYIEQDPSPAFGKMSFEQRGAAMFSRYVGPMLKRMAKDPALVADGSLDGFTTILEWKKDGTGINGRPVHETVAVFIDKPSATEYLAGRIDAKLLAERARVMGFDGETALGMITLAPTWDDNFVATFKVQNYQLEAGVTC